VKNFNAVYADDSVVWDIRVIKLWSDEGSIEVITTERGKLF
jgi:Holliday junction resolvase RusA-like endonuclease